MITVLIADDQPSVRLALRTFLETQSDISVIAEAEGGDEAVAKATVHRPDVVLMDVRMPAGDGISATAQLAGPAASSPVPVIVITTLTSTNTYSVRSRTGPSAFSSGCAAQPHHCRGSRGRNGRGARRPQCHPAGDR